MRWGAITARAARCRAGYRNGYRRGRLKTADVLYLFVDRIAERLHLGQPRDAAT